MKSFKVPGMEMHLRFHELPGPCRPERRNKNELKQLVFFTLLIINRLKLPRSESF
jgi:hypothetical protein